MNQQNSRTIQIYILIM